MLGRRFETGKRSYVKATLQHEGELIPVKLRLKGGRTDHINQDKRWSFRIKTRKGKTVFGMKTFAIQHPVTRAYQIEAVFQDFARQQNIIPLKYFFINVAINGEQLGVMAVEEIPAKEMLEREGYKEGLIFQFEDENVRNNYHSVLESIVVDHPDLANEIGDYPVENLYSKNFKHQQQYQRIRRIFYNALNAPIEEITRRNNSPEFQRQRPVAIGLMKGMLQGKLEPSDVFDAEKTGRFFAYLALWGDSHAASFRNVRFYFNPYTYKFEPIAHDSNAYSSTRTEIYPDKNNFSDHEVNRILLSDSAIHQSFIESARNYLTLAKSQHFESKLRNIETSHLSALRTDFHLIPPMDFSSLLKAIQRINKEIDTDKFYSPVPELLNDKTDPAPLKLPPQYRAPEVIQAELIHSDNQFRLVIHNLFPLRTYLTELLIKIDGKQVPVIDHLEQRLPIEIGPFYYNEFYGHSTISLKNLTSEQEVSIEGVVRIDTQNDIDYHFSARNSYPALARHPLKHDSIIELLKANDFLSYEEQTNTILIQSGNHIIEDMLIFPADNTLKIEAGAHLKFTSEAGMLVQGNVIAEGSLQQPIIFDSVESNLTSGWSGFSVIQAKTKSKLDHVHFKNTGYAATQNWQLTAGVTFYQSDVDISNSLFDGSVAEDALNIVQSNFNFTHSNIRNTRSDGLDTDFSSGVISDSQFSEIGGDGIDFSGSSIQVTTSNFDVIRDKAISVGENSLADIESARISNSGTGLAVKDGSVAKIKNSDFKQIKYSSIMSYNKKPEYGPSRVTASNVIFREHEQAIVSQIGNILVIDNDEITPISIDIDKLYKTGNMKK